MNVVDCGSGPPVVVVPGIQGRWEWMRPGIEALAQRCRVVTCSLADEPTSGARFDEARGFSSYVDQIVEAMDEARLERAVICGVSYGGLIAATFARRYPSRASALILASAIPPQWRPDRPTRVLLGAPRALTPLFCIAAVRSFPEMVAAAGGPIAGLTLARRHVLNVFRHRFSPPLMARRVRLLDAASLEPELQTMPLPVLVVTGEPALDRVVSVEQTRQYLALWPHAQSATIARTGHLGIITKPLEFARAVTPFIHRASYREVRRVV